jgi:chorismate mutase
MNSKTQDIEQYYLVKADLLPEAVLKTMQVKELLAQGTAKTIHEAVEQVGLSRSAFYKYKDGIFPLNSLDRERIVTVSMELTHRSGILSRVLALMASFEGNVLTINQTIPLLGKANVIISLDTSLMGDRLFLFMDALRIVDGVSKAAVIGQG